MFEVWRYLFAAQCIWWLAALVVLDPALCYFLDDLGFPSDQFHDNELCGPIRVSIGRVISSTPPDVKHRTESDEYEVPTNDEYQAEPSRRTRYGRVNAIPQTQRQHKDERKRLARLKRSVALLEANRNWRIICSARIVWHPKLIWLRFSSKHRRQWQPFIPCVYSIFNNYQYTFSQNMFTKNIVSRTMHKNIYLKQSTLLTPNASPNTLDHCPQMHLWVSQSRPPSASPNMLDHCL